MTEQGRALQAGKGRSLVWLPVVLAGLFLQGSLLGCSGNGEDAQQDKEEKQIPVPVVAAPAADGPRVASISSATLIYDRPSEKGTVVGYMRAGGQVARSAEPHTKEGCEGGWYPVHPRGFLCVGETATLNLGHPTLSVMKTQPNREGALPYTYVRTEKATGVYVWDRSKGAAVREVGKLRAKSGVAVIGSWNAMDPSGKMQQLAMMPNGQFVLASSIAEADVSDFRGVELNAETKLPLAFIVKRGVRAWQVERQSSRKLGEIEPHTVLPLTGRFRTVAGEKFWATEDDRYVRHKDATILLRRHVFPDFATPEQKWIDISIITGTMVLYEGHKPVYATLVSVGQDRMGDPEKTASTKMGTFFVTGKNITANKAGTKPFDDLFEVQDVPWVQELSSGQALHGAYWHNRFGVEHGPGNMQVAPADAVRAFNWSDPQVPSGWHGVTKAGEGEKKTIVLVRK